MSTDRKIRASQQNGAKSHGPVTSAGRLKSSANSARHHLLSKTILLENERPEAFADLLAGLTREFNPQTEAERALVETMAVSRWRQMRIWAIERATLASAMEAYDAETTEPATRAALAFRSLADDSRTLDLLNRYETRFERQFARSLNLLMKLADPENPLNRFCQTNLIPKSDADSNSDPGLPPTDSDSGAAILVCPDPRPSDEQDPSADPEERDESQGHDLDFADAPPAASPASIIHSAFIVVKAPRVAALSHRAEPPPDRLAAVA